MTRNPTNRIPGLGFTPKADHLRELDRHMRDMFKPAVRVSHEECDHMFRKVG